MNLSNIAEETVGFSGADLQAVIYNAHLDVVHSSVLTGEESESPNSSRKGKGKAGMVQNSSGLEKGNYRQIAPVEDEDAVRSSSSERALMRNRVSPHRESAPTELNDLLLDYYYRPEYVRWRRSLSYQNSKGHAEGMHVYALCWSPGLL